MQGGSKLHSWDCVSKGWLEILELGAVTFIILLPLEIPSVPRQVLAPGLLWASPTPIRC